jgi:hypothetical protein
MKSIIIPLLGLAALNSATAQIEIVNAGATGNQVNLSEAYTQNFDTLARTGTSANPWSNNTTLPGWYAYQNSVGDMSFYNANNPAQLASFGGEGALDRALGSGLNFGSGDAVNFGVRFINGNSTNIGSFTVSFEGEQWYKWNSSPGPADSLVFSYQIFDANSGGFSATNGWVFVEELTFTSPISGAGAGFLDGNLPANRVADISSTIDGVVLASGQELWLRWTATNQESVNDHGLAIDNLVVSFTAIPEPATYGVLLAGFVVVSSIFRRRHRNPSR